MKFLNSISAIFLITGCVMLTSACNDKSSETTATDTVDQLKMDSTGSMNGMPDSGIAPSPTDTSMQNKGMNNSMNGSSGTTNPNGMNGTNSGNTNGTNPTGTSSSQTGSGSNRPGSSQTPGNTNTNGSAGSNNTRPNP